MTAVHGLIGEGTSAVMADAARPHSDASTLSGVPSAEFRAIVSRSFARRHLLVSRGRVHGRELIVGAPGTSPAALHNIGTALGVPLEVTTAPPDQVAALIDRYLEDDGSVGEQRPDLTRLADQTDRDVLSTAGKGPVIQLVDSLVFNALQRNASDIHIQPLADRVLVRYRVDGVLHDVLELPPQAALAVTSRFKVMGRMDVAERRLAQDGRATVTVGRLPNSDSSEGRAVDLRLSTLPTSYGERVVVRLLDNARGAHLMDFVALGMPPAVEREFLARAARAAGIILVTGPTGSGKTTTLYAALRWLATSDTGAGRSRAHNILTIEDPIEYELATIGLSISQTQVNTRKGVTFAGGLRHILRQDPDVIMVGEIRDVETARLAIQASLTGHLVLSTLHTNDAPGAVTRLVDLGIEPYLVAASLTAVLAQRLVRVVHSDCRGEGCEGCLRSGYLGRRGVFELLVVDEGLRSVISRDGASDMVRRAGTEAGMRTLHDEACRLVQAGVTTDAEIARVIQGVA